MLIGRLEGTVRTRSRRTGNLNTERPTALRDPKDYMRIDLEAGAASISSAFTTATLTPAQPSATDLAAAWEGYSYVIVAVNKSRRLSLV